MCFTPSSRDQLACRSPDAQLRALVNRSVRFVPENIVGVESLSEELLAEDARPIDLLLEILSIVLSPIKLGTRIKAAEIQMTADMVPVGMSNEHSRQWRQSRRVSSQRFICTFCEIGASAGVNRDQLMPVPRNHEVVFREFEAGERVDATGNDLGDAPRGKGMTGGSVFGKRCRQRDRVIEVGIAAAAQVLLGFCLIVIVEREFAEMIVDFAQPCRMRRLVGVLDTPGEFLLCRLSLPKVAGKLGMYDAGNPVHDEDLAA